MLKTNEGSFKLKRSIGKLKETTKLVEEAYNNSVGKMRARSKKEEEQKKEKRRKEEKDDPFYVPKGK